MAKSNKARSADRDLVQARLNLDWSKLVDHEAKLYADLAAHTALDRKALRTWWQSLADVLDAYRYRLARYGRLEGQAPVLTMEVTNLLCNLAGDLANGNSPSLVTKVRTAGRTAASSSELDAIRVAVAYHRACQPAGLEVANGVPIKIKNSHPVKTICKLYGVKRTTVQGWIKTYRPADFGDSLPRKTSLEKNDDDDQRNSSAEGNGLATLLRKKALQFLSVSRSHGSIADRSRKLTSPLKPQE